MLSNFADYAAEMKHNSRDIESGGLWRKSCTFEMEGSNLDKYQKTLMD